MGKIVVNGRRIGVIGLGGQSVFMTVDHFNAPGETVHANGIFTEPGGKAYNQAVAAARLGADVIYFGAVGNDSYGKECAEFLENEGIAHRLMKIENCGTAYACILSDSRGENRVTVYSGAANRLTEGFIRSCRADIADCALLLLGLECPLEATLAALDIAESLGIATILNPAPARKLDSALLRRFDLITPNAQEAAYLFNLKHAEPTSLCEAFSQHGLKRAVVTLGGDGALLFCGDEAFIYPAVKCRAVDTTGAGDCFNGALSAALANGESLAEAAEFAVNASALSVRRSHVMTALPYINEVRDGFIPVQSQLIWRKSN